MIRHENMIYGTVRECVKEILRMTDENHFMKFPDFDYAVDTPEDLTLDDLEQYGNGIGEIWLTCRDIAEMFDGDTIHLVSAHYGGGGMNCLELDPDYMDECEDSMVRLIENSSEDIGWGVTAADHILIELREN